MSPDLTEHAFQDDVKEELAESGWRVTEPNSDEFDDQNNLLPTDLKTHLRGYQNDELDDFQARHGNDWQEELLLLFRNFISRNGVLRAFKNAITDQNNSRIFDDVFVYDINEGIREGRNGQRNEFTVVPNLRYNPDTNEEVDYAFFVNGLPVATVELKGNMSDQTIEDAKRQYRQRSTGQTILNQRFSLAHFAVDDQRAALTTELRGEETEFEPYNRGEDGYEEHSNPKPREDETYRTDYLWDEVLSPSKFAFLMDLSFYTENEQGNEELVFPYFHQQRALTKLIEDSREHGTGNRHLINHFAGAGKTFEMGWLAHSLINLERPGQTGAPEPVYNSVIVVSDRLSLDDNLRKDLQLMEAKRTEGTVFTPDHSSDLKEAIENGEPIIVTTIQKFPEIADTIETMSEDRRYGVVIDEAHSSQGKEYTKSMKEALDTIEDSTEALTEHRGRAQNLSFFAFTATPRDRTLTLFTEDGEATDRYSRDQAIAEENIVDVLDNYFSLRSYTDVAPSGPDVEDELLPEQQTKQKINSIVESKDKALKKKAEFAVDKFFEHLRSKDMPENAKAKVDCSSKEAAVTFYRALVDKIEEYRQDNYFEKEWLNEVVQEAQAVIDYTGTVEDGTETIRPHDLHDLGASANVGAQFGRDDSLRFLVVVDKYQTGFDEPKLGMIMVDKRLSSPVNAVQTIERGNRTAPDKESVFIYDFRNNFEDILKHYEECQQQYSGQTGQIQFDGSLSELYTELMTVSCLGENTLEVFKECRDGDRSDVQERIVEPIQQSLEEFPDDRYDSFRKDLQDYTELFTLYDFVAETDAITEEQALLYELAKLLTNVLQPRNTAANNGPELQKEDLRVEEYMPVQEHPEADDEEDDEADSSDSGEAETDRERLKEIVEDYNSRHGVEPNLNKILGPLTSIYERLKTEDDLKQKLESNPRTKHYSIFEGYLQDLTLQAINNEEEETADLIYNQLLKNNNGSEDFKERLLNLLRSDL